MRGGVAVGFLGGGEAGLHVASERLRAADFLRRDGGIVGRRRPICDGIEAGVWVVKCAVNVEYSVP